MRSSSCTGSAAAERIGTNLIGATSYTLAYVGSPLFIEPTASQASDVSAFLQWLTEHRADLDALLLEYGGTIFRGSPIASSAEFSQFARHPVTGDLLYRNVAHVDPGAGFSANLPEARRQRVETMPARQALRTGYYFGDSSPIGVSESAQLRALFDKLELSWKWLPGDIMLLDNPLTAHGRNPFEGEFRDVQVALLA